MDIVEAMVDLKALSWTDTLRTPRLSSLEHAPVSFRQNDQHIRIDDIIHLDIQKVFALWLRHAKAKQGPHFWQNV